MSVEEMGWVVIGNVWLAASVILVQVTGRNIYTFAGFGVLGLCLFLAVRAKWALLDDQEDDRE